MDKQTRLARTILNGFYSYFADFENITLAARTRFEQGRMGGDAPGIDSPDRLV